MLISCDIASSAKGRQSSTRKSSTKARGLGGTRINLF